MGRKQGQRGAHEPLVSPPFSRAATAPWGSHRRMHPIFSAFLAVFLSDKARSICQIVMIKTLIRHLLGARQTHRCCPNIPPTQGSASTCCLLLCRLSAQGPEALPSAGVQGTAGRAAGAAGLRCVPSWYFTRVS